MTNKAFSSQDINRAADFGEKYLFYGSPSSVFSDGLILQRTTYCTGFNTFFFSEFDILTVNTFRFVSCWMRVKMLKKIKAWAALLISPKS